MGQRVQTHLQMFGVIQGLALSASTLLLLCLCSWSSCFMMSFGCLGLPAQWHSASSSPSACHSPLPLFTLSALLSVKYINTIFIKEKDPPSY